MGKKQIELHRKNGLIAMRYAALQQRKWWVGRDGELVRRKELTVAHKANLVGWLVREAHQFTSYQTSNCWDAPDEVATACEVDAQNPTGWMLDLPFVRALLEDLTPGATYGDGYVDGLGRAIREIQQARTRRGAETAYGMAIAADVVKAALALPETPRG